MTNKDNMKKTIINDFNKKQNYSYILKKIGDNEMKIFQKIVIPCCIIVLIFVCGIITFINKNKYLKDNNDGSMYNNNILINQIDNLDNLNSSSIAGELHERTIEDLKEEYPFIDNILAIVGNTKQIKIEEYRYDYLNYQGYYITYTDNSNKGVEIFFSKTMVMQPRDIGGPIVLDKLEDSYIMNVPVKIVQTGNSYIAFFEKNDTYFDITVINSSQDELIDLIQSIIV